MTQQGQREASDASSHSDQRPLEPLAAGALSTLDDDSLASQLRARINETREITAESSVIEPLVLARSEPPRSQRQRLITIAVCGVGVLAVALLIHRAVDSQAAAGPPTCSVQLREPERGTIDDIESVVLELPTGQTIAVRVEGGDTLVFECPAVVVNARLQVQRRHAPSRAYAEIQLSPTPGLQTIELRPELRAHAGGEAHE